MTKAFTKIKAGLDEVLASAEGPQFVAYIRVSTGKQGRSGLGLEAQQQAIKAFAQAAGGTIIETFTEVETGKGHDALEKRPELRVALARSKKLKATIVVAKLDRLGRDV